ncbi:type I polyketide synthase [Streptomyces sp. DSM 42041]|uniref:Type I polyketide synthase n=1 Tax=Streptomyces hazeniae TaxID=3075538 RepID=A0ABU2NNU3_9ACTN|nr:type I polyketide synthase [Streptomyces sp. DSM 42041]MDT0378445.1 type I polyketide synthase [Streptomyces sp. DSM 42041]
MTEHPARPTTDTVDTVDPSDAVDDPTRLIAVVGMAGRFPGAPDVDRYWELLTAGEEAVRPIPPDRWDTSAQLDPVKKIPGVAALLDDLDLFDPGFFGISPREAEDIDPQQRLMLETGWSALENAGVPAESVRGSRTGVYVGALWHDYALARKERGVATTQHTAVGNALDVIASRLSYSLGLRGPSLVVETGCSSGLVGVHLAAGALRSGEIDGALVGGVNLILTPDMSIGLTHFGGLSPDGHCRAFSAQANGFVRGEGAIAVYLKRLDRALADGDRVQGVLVATAANNDGGGHSLVSPNVEAQKELLRQVYADAGVPMNRLAYVEAHGTGTLRGDPIEAEALGRTLGAARPADAGPLLIGSVKTNIGHLEAAAGLAGLVKTVLTLRHRTVPASLHADETNPNIPFDELNLKVATQQATLRADGPVYAGVNSFGWGGTNAHVVLRTPPAPAGPAATATSDRPTALLLPLSAHNEAALRDRARALLPVLPDDDGAGTTGDHAAAVAGTLAWERDHFPLRAAVTAPDPATLRERLGLFAEDPTAEIPGVVTGRAEQPGRVAFVLPGQGSQWAGMGRRLYAESPLFAEVVARCATALEPHFAGDLTAIVSGEAGDGWLERADLIQPTLWAMSLGLAELWRAAGVEPDVVIGHSQGEVTAATIAGLLSYEDGARIIARRSALATRAAGRGRMLAVDLGLEDARKALDGFEDVVSLAVNNGPSSCVLSGDGDAVLMLRELLEADGTFCRLVNVDYASHCHHMDELTDELIEELRPLAPRSSGTAMMSTVRVREMAGEELDAAYWAANLRQPVLFADAMGKLFDSGVTHVVEISPHPVLTPALEQLAATRETPVTVLPTLRRDEGSLADLTLSLARAYAGGLRPFGGLPRRPGAAVPGYPWQRQRYWLPAARRRSAGPGGLAFAFTPATAEQDVHEGRTELSLDELPWLRDHRVHDAVVVPGAAMLALAVSAARTRTGRCPGALHDVRFRSDLTLADEPVALCATSREDGAEAVFTLRSLQPGAESWTRHATARIGGPAGTGLPDFPQALLEVPPDTAEDFYAACAARGLHYGPAFQGVQALHRDEDGHQVLADVRLPERCRAGVRPGELHAALWDAALQVSLALVPEGDTVVPVAVRRIDFAVGPEEVVTGVWSHAVRTADGRYDLVCYDAESRRPLLRMAGLAFQTIEDAEADAVDTTRLHRFAFRPADDEQDAPPRSSAPGITRWTVCVVPDAAAGPSGTVDAAAATGAGADLVAALDRLGATAAVVPAPALTDADTVAALLTGEDDGQRAGVAFVAPGAGHGLAAQRDGLLSLTAVARAAAALPVPPAVAMVTDGAQAVVPGEIPDPGAALYWGFGRVLRREHPELGTALVDVRTGVDGWAEACARQLLGGDGEDQTALRGTDRFAGRLVRGEQQDDDGPAWAGPPQPFRLRPHGSGLWEELAFRPQPRTAPAAGLVEVQVTAAGLNFIDVMKAMGTYPDRSAGADLLGGECAGVVSAVGPEVTGLAVGDRVVACGFGTVASHVTVRAEHVAPVPEHLTDVQAAGLPLVTTTAWYALADQARLEAGETVLVHSAAGGLGLAAVHAARALGATVIATAGTEEKRAYLRDRGVEHVLDSRDLSWAAAVERITGGRGVDVVLNSLSGAAMEHGLAALAEDGRFVEVGKRDIYAARTVSLEVFAKGISFSAVDIAGLLTRRPARFARLLREVWQRVGDGTLPPLPVTEHAFRDAGETLRTMARGEHIGKLVLTGPERVREIVPEPLSGGRLRPDATYLITGGLGALGLSLAEHLADRGAGSLALLGRSAPAEAAQRRIDALREGGTQVTVHAADVGDRAALAGTLDRLRHELPPLRGVFHAAGVLDDAVVGNLTAPQVRKVLAPKVDGARHLDALTAEDPLDLFVLFSSVAGLVGNPGQAAYAAGNTYLDALAVARRRRGLPALAVQWGPFADIGLAADESIRGARLADHGMAGFTAEEAWQALDHLLGRPGQVVSYVPLDARHWFDAYPETAAQPSWQVMARLAQDGGGAAHGGEEFLAGLRRAPEEDRPRLVESKVRELAGRVLRLQADSIDREAPFKSLGLDSLMSLELRNRLETAFGLKLSPTLLWTYGSTAALSGMLTGLCAGTENAHP